MQVLDGQKETTNTSKSLFRKFLEEDDGGEFVMLNQVELVKGSARHPVSGEGCLRDVLYNFGTFSMRCLSRWTPGVPGNGRR